MESNQRSQLAKDVAERINSELYQPLIKCEYLTERSHTINDGKGRPDYQRDYTRILYSTAFRRLQGKMQLLGVQSTNFNRNRLTHSLEVSQIAKSIADAIGYTTDIYVVDACSLAHDIGNPPFGHYGERILNQIIDKERTELKLKDLEGFEGNAQTLRVLTHLQSKESSYEGMDLTIRTLLGVTKYYNRYSEDQKKFVYSDNYDELKKYIDSYHIQLRTLDVQIMDISDEIAYAAHDIEDTLKSKLFTIDEFLHELKYSEYLKQHFTAREIENAQKKMEEYVGDVKKKLSNSYSPQYHSLFCKELGSKLIFELIQDIDLIEQGEKKIIGFKTLGALSAGLKRVTFDCVNQTNQVKLYEKEGSIVLNGLFDFYMADQDFLPLEYRTQSKIKDDSAKIRTIIDYISGMMDSYAINKYEKVYGKKHFDTFGLFPYERKFNE